MRRFIIFITCTIVAFGGALWTWQAVVQSIVANAQYAWLMPGIAVSVMAIALIVALFFAQQRWHVAVASSVIFGSALFFVHSWAVFGAIAVAILATVSMASAMAASMRDHLRLRVFTHAHAGIGRFVTALALMISALFYTVIIQRDAATLMLSQSLRATATGSIARMVLPAPLTTGTGPGGAVTVDDFIADVLQRQAAPSEKAVAVQFLENYANAVTQRLQGILPRTTTPATSKSDATVLPAVVAQARMALAQELDMPLTGTEPVADVFVQSLEQQIRSFAERKILPKGYKFSHALAGVIAFFLFLSLGWIGSFVKIFWLFAVQGLFTLLRASGIVRVRLIATQKEEIA